MSPVLTHFCHRARAQSSMVSAEIKTQNAQQRLASILWEGQLRTHVTFSGGDPAVCLTEVTEAGLQFLLEQRNYQPWGVIFGRQSVFNAGGAPVWYTRDDEHAHLQPLSSRIRSWAVRLAPGRSDWLEEREWRLPRTIDPDTGRNTPVSLNELCLGGVLVGDPAWSPARYAHEADPPTGHNEVDNRLILPDCLVDVPRVWWNGNELQELDPWLTSSSH